MHRHAASQETDFTPRIPCGLLSTSRRSPCSLALRLSAIEGGHQQPLLHESRSGCPIATLIAVDSYSLLDYSRQKKKITRHVFLLPSRVFQYADIREVGSENGQVPHGDASIGPGQ